MPTMLRHPKKRGEWVEMQFMARAAAHGLDVSKPWGDCSRYDFIVEHKGCCKRVQVKSTYFYRPTRYACRFLTGDSYSRQDLELIAVYIIPENVWYIIPIDLVAGQQTVSLAPWRVKSKFRPYMEAWHLLRRKNGNK